MQRKLITPAVAVVAGHGREHGKRPALRRASAITHLLVIGLQATHEQGVTPGQGQGRQCKAPEKETASPGGWQARLGPAHLPHPPLHLFDQIQERLLELGCHGVGLVETGDGAALAQALRSSLGGMAGEEACHYLGRHGQQPRAVVKAPRGRDRNRETDKLRNRDGDRKRENNRSQVSRPRSTRKLTQGTRPGAS